MDKKRLIADGIALVVYLLAANPALTGISVHEWLGLAALVVLFVHVATSVGKASSWNMVLDALILIVLMATMVSGVLISGAVLPAFGWYAGGYYFWDPLHAMAAKGLLALLVVHVVVHWKWFANMFKRKRGKRDEC